MGYYIQTDSNKGKGEYLVKYHGAKEVSLQTAREQFDGNHDTVIVVDNPGQGFEAAGFAFDKQEFNAFTRQGDTRPKKFYQLPKGVAARLSGYRSAGYKR